MTRPRTPEFFPRMKVRGKRRRQPKRRLAPAWAEQVAAACAAGGVSLERFARAVRAFAATVPPTRPIAITGIHKPNEGNTDD